MNKKQKIAMLQILAIREDVGVPAFNSIINEINNGIDIDCIFKSEKKPQTKKQNQTKTIGYEKEKTIEEIKKNLDLIRKNNGGEVNNFLAHVNMVSLIGDNDECTINNIISLMQEKSEREIKSISKKIIAFKDKNSDQGYEKLANFLIEK